MANLLLFSMPGGGEWLIILLVVVFLFGGKKIPELMRGIGKGVREFNAAKANLQDEFDKGIKEEEAKKLSENK
jgi:sec-independent protein translocase protein TatA